jgi:hypothetical protein
MARGRGGRQAGQDLDFDAPRFVGGTAAVINHPLEAPGLLWSNVADRIQEMDAEGIDVEALSINPFWYRAAIRAPLGSLVISLRHCQTCCTDRSFW